MRLLKNLLLFMLIMFFAFSAIAYEKLNWQSKVFAAGKANLTADGFIVSRLLDVANFSPEFQMPVELVYNSANAGSGILGYGWRAPQLESKLFLKPYGVDWITPWGEKNTVLNKQHKNSEPMFEDYKGTGNFTPNADFETEKIKNGNWIVTGKNTKAGWIFEYKDDGVLQTISAPSGRLLLFNYSGNKLTAVMENNVAFISLSYSDNSSNPGKITINGIDFALTYGTQSNLLLDKNKLEPALRTNNQMLASIVCGNLKPVNFNYDSDGYLAGIKHGSLMENFTVQHETEQERHAFIKKIQEMKENKLNTVDVIPEKLAGRILKDNIYIYSYPEKNVVVLSDGLGRQSTYIYDEKRGMLKVKDFVGLETSIYYFRAFDPAYNGKISRIIDAKGRVALNCTYDNITGELSIVRDIADNETFYFYDQNRHLSSVSRSIPGGKQPLLRINYDDKSNPVEYLRLDASGNPVTTTRLSYNDNSDLTAVDNGEQRINLNYNNFGKLFRITNTFGDIATLEYDQYNRLKSATAPNSIHTVYAYTPTGMISEIKSFDSPDEKELLNSLKISYDADGRPESYTDNQGRIKKIERDAVGRVITEYFPDNTAVQYSYSALGQLHKVIDQNRNPIEFEWTKFGTIGKKNSAENQVTDYNYDQYGLVQSMTSKFKNKPTIDREIKYTYDNYDRISAMDYGKSHADGQTNVKNVATNTQQVAFKYDSRGKVLQQVQRDGVRTTTADFRYDQFDQLTERIITTNTGATTSRIACEYVYDCYGRNTKRLITFNDGLKRKSEWIYDKYGRLVAVNDEGKVITYEYDSQSRISVRRTDNIPVYYTYTKHGQLNSKSVGALPDNNPTAYIKYFYSTDGQMTAREIYGSKLVYQYDKLGQLLAVVDSTGKAVEQYSYDSSGNILSKTIDDGLATRRTVFKYDKANQLVSSIEYPVTKDKLTIPANSTSNTASRYIDYEYDAAGRMIREGDKYYVYGWMDKVMSVAENNNDVVSRTDYEYGIDGQIAVRTDKAGKSESFTWDGLALIRRDSTNFVNEPALTGGNPILAFSKDNSKLLFEDILGTTVGSVENGKFNSVNRTAFGELLPSSNTAENSSPSSDFFTGKPHVSGLGYSFLFRNYRSELGKWQNSDPTGYPDGWNNLAYCNNWVNIAFDPSGAYIIITGDARFRALVNSALSQMRSTAEGEKIYQKLYYSNNIHLIQETAGGNKINWAGNNSVINFNPYISAADGWTRPAWAGLAHEMVHAFEINNNTLSLSNYFNGIIHAEYIACKKTNQMLLESNSNATTRRYYSVELPADAINPNSDAGIIAGIIPGIIAAINAAINADSSAGSSTGSNSEGLPEINVQKSPPKDPVKMQELKVY